MSVHAYHPETRADLMVTEDQLLHMRASGWLTKAEHDQNEAARQATDAAASAKPAKDEGK